MIRKRQVKTHTPAQMRPEFIAIQIGALFYVLDKTFGYYFDRNGLCYGEHTPQGMSEQTALAIRDSYNQAIKVGFER